MRFVIVMFIIAIGVQDEQLHTGNYGAASIYCIARILNMLSRSCTVGDQISMDTSKSRYLIFNEE